jgi:hypothetical protein
MALAKSSLVCHLALSWLFFPGPAPAVAEVEIADAAFDAASSAVSALKT